MNIEGACHPVISQCPFKLQMEGNSGNRKITLKIRFSVTQEMDKVSTRNINKLDFC